MLFEYKSNFEEHPRYYRVVNQGQYLGTWNWISHFFRFFFQILLGTCQDLHFTHCKKLLDLCNFQFHMSTLFPGRRRGRGLIQFGCNQLVHRTETFCCILAVKSLGKGIQILKSPRKIIISIYSSFAAQI